MRVAIPVLLSLVFALGPNPGGAAAKAPPKPSGPKGTCAAITFRPLPQGGADGDATAGLYKSRFARLELHAKVANGTAGDYYLVANGNRLAAAPAQLPAAATSCAAAKHMPKPEAAASPCTGDRFTAVIAHAGKDRVALLFASAAGTWKFCSAGTF